IDLHRERNALKKAARPGMDAVSKGAPQEALRHVDQAFAHFFGRARLTQAGKRTGTVGSPKRKPKKTGLGSFPLTGSIVVFPNALPLPRVGPRRLNACG